MIMNEWDGNMPDTCSPEMIAFVEWLVETGQLMDVWEWIKYPLEKPYNFYEQYIEFLKETKK